MMKKTRFKYFFLYLFIIVSYALYSQQDENYYIIKLTSKYIKIYGIEDDNV